MRGHLNRVLGWWWLGSATTALGLLAGCGSTAATTRTTSPHTGVSHRQKRQVTTRATPTTATTSPAVPRSRPDPARLLGQMIVARFQGATPSPSFLGRIRSGQVGGVILFADNVAGGTEATRSLTATLQHAAARGHNPPLLIMTDQEGGPV